MKDNSIDRPRNCIKRFGRYFFVGGVVGIVCLLLRELIALYTTDTASGYMMSIMIVYVVGIILSFFLNRIFTFNFDKGKDKQSITRFLSFSGVSVLGAICTAVFASAINYGLDLRYLIGEYGEGFSFAVGASLTSVLTYYINARFVFRGEGKEESGT